jgi:hypothetical protein
VAKATKIDLFGQLNGIDFHIEIVPDEGERGLDVLIKSAEYLKSKGALPRPQGKSFGGGNKQAPPEKCPTCELPIEPRNWTTKDGKQFKVYQCPDVKDHFKPIFKPA